LCPDQLCGDICHALHGDFHGEAEWFEIGTTWTYNWNVVADPDQVDNTYTYAVTEIVDYLGQSCSKIEAESGSFACLVHSPPYYMHFENDTVFFATEVMTEFAIGYVLAENAEWQYEVTQGEFSSSYNVHPNDFCCVFPAIVSINSFHDASYLVLVKFI
jgi:hypothetical protein